MNIMIQNNQKNPQKELESQRKFLAFINEKPIYKNYYIKKISKINNIANS